MCGICGYFRAHHVPAEHSILEQMNTTLYHRGPDSDGFYLSGSLGMAMRRLAIIDLAGGRQPLMSEDESVVVMFNGEIYNFQELRLELKKAGHHFATLSDTEVIVHAYEEWGDDCLTRFNGMFAISLWDIVHKRLLLARDRMGKKPIYWHHSSHGLVWGSEAKAVLAAPWVQRRINPLALHHYLTLQYTPNPLTIYDGIHQLPAAHKLVLEAGCEPVVFHWWQLDFEPKWKLSDAEAIESARHLLQEAVKRRLISDVPLGAFLSGGIDSAIIVALMSELSSKPVKTFTIGFEEPRFSEVHHARSIAERYQTDHHEFIFRPQDVIVTIEHAVTAADEPLADPAMLPLLELARQARQFVTVALCGDGGDEALAGYRRYVLDEFLKPYAALPSWLTQRMVPAIASTFPEPGWIPEDLNPITGLKRLAQFAAVTPKASLIRWGSYFSQADKLSLYTDRWRDEFASVDTADWLAGFYDTARAKCMLDCTLSADQVTYLAGDLLPKTDRATMASSVEARAPFLDVEWVEWTARLPKRFKMRGIQTKWLLYHAFADKLPPQIAGRGKQGFSLPLGLWLRDELRSWANALLSENQALSEWFRPAAVKQLWDEHDNGRINHGKRLWALLMFAVWLNKCSEG